MSLLDRLFETDAEEAAYLAQSPEGSTNHWLSSLPVTFTKYPRGHVLVLPTDPLDPESRLVVVPITSHPAKSELNFDGYWDCVVVGGDDGRYRPGGYDIAVSWAYLRRSRELVIA